MFTLQGHVDARQVEVMFGMAPRTITSAVRAWFASTRTRFLGSKGRKSGGTYTRWLRQRPLKGGRTGTWSPQALGAFRGSVRAGSRLQAMKLVLGTPSKGGGFVGGLQRMAAGGYTVSSGRQMTIPLMSNLAQMGVTRAYNKAFHRMLDADELVPVSHGDQMVWVHRPSVDAGLSPYGAALFVGRRRVTIPKQDLQFESRFEREWPRYVELGERRLQRTMRDLELGYRTAR